MLTTSANARSVTNRFSSLNAQQSPTVSDSFTSNVPLSSQYPRATGRMCELQSEKFQTRKLMDDLHDLKFGGEEIVTSSDGSYTEHISSCTYGTNTAVTPLMEEILKSKAQRHLPSGIIRRHHSRRVTAPRSLHHTLYGQHSSHRQP